MSILPCSSLYAQSVSVFVSIIIVLCLQSCSAKHHRVCPPSSCGKIRNIKYPFRQKGDPHGCGLRRYELDCVNNVTVFTLLSGKYHVHEIDYKKYVIRLSDAAVAEDTACSIPRYFLSRHNFSDMADDFPMIDRDVVDHIQGYRRYYSFPNAILFLNCNDSVTDDPRYVEVNPSHCNSRGNNLYAVVGVQRYEEKLGMAVERGEEKFGVMDIKVGCSLKVATYGNQTHDSRNLSYADIRKSLEDGFLLSWFTRVICRDECVSKDFCYINNSTNKIECTHWGFYYITFKRGTLSRILGYTRGFVIDVITGFLNRIEDVKQPLYWYNEGDLIGGSILPIFIVTRYIFGFALLFVLFIYKWRRRHFSMYENIENFLLEDNLNPIRYEFRQIKKMTKGFKVKLGQGGFASVYRGKLQSGLDVAVKMLNTSKANGEQFISEVATIGRIHHMNVVRLIGYCVEREKRALVYEYMPNGSLDKHIFSKEGSIPLSYEKTYEISLGIACGIAYLHQGCDVQILHFDIKPHNILLDDNFIPKISDFGLAKLYPDKDMSIVLTELRGTLGYMAPELFYRNIGRVSYKADIYSLGMLLMEMGSRRRNSDGNVEHSSQHYFPFWIYDQFNEGKNIDMEDASQEDKDMVRKMFIVALWCIQLKPCDRPSMKKVVEMLEGKVESLEMPPKPSYCPHETIGDDGEINSDQTSWSDLASFTETLGKTESNHLLENNI